MQRRLLGAAVVLAFAGLAACGDDDDGDTTPTSEGGIPQGLTTIMVLDNRFLPVGLQVPVGTRVTWQWDSEARHSIVGNFYEQEVRSDEQSGEETFQFTFERAGVFEYQCGVHGAAMAGRVTLQ